MLLLGLSHQACIYVSQEKFWFQAKPIVLYIGYGSTHVSKVLDSHVSAKYCKPLKELIADEDGSISQSMNLNYNDLKSIYISEPGLWQLLAKSRMPGAEPFQTWVFEEVLPSIRRTGRYERSGQREGTLSRGIDTIQTSSALEACKSNKPLVPAQKRSLALDNRQRLSAIFLAEFAGCKLKLNADDQVLLRTASAILLTLAQREYPDVPLAALSKKFGGSRNDVKVPAEDLGLARSALHEASRICRSTSTAIPAKDDSRAATAARRSKGGLFRKSVAKRRRFFAGSAAHAQAKNAACALWLRHLPVSGNIDYLDDFEQSEGTRLRTTIALLEKAAVDVHRLHSANPCEGVCTALRAAGVRHVFQGLWEDAPWANGKTFSAIYLDLCSGDVEYVKRHLQLAIARAASTCVLSFTITERCFEKEHSLQKRCWALEDFMRHHGWLPASDGRATESFMTHKSSGGMKVVTECWRKPA